MAELRQQWSNSPTNEDHGRPVLEVLRELYWLIEVIGDTQSKTDAFPCTIPPDLKSFNLLAKDIRMPGRNTDEHCNGVKLLIMHCMINHGWFENNEDDKFFIDKI